MKTRAIIPGVLSMFFSLMLSAQTMDYFKEGISPQVALINQYGTYPVDYSTGLVDITIPLYTLETSGISMPIQLKFHPSGLRSDEQEGLLGLRWALFAGGHVSRIIKGYPDDYSYPFNDLVSNPDYRPSFHTLYGTTSTQYKNGGTCNGVFLNPPNMYPFLPPGEYKDTERDIFSYSLPSGRSGRFILDGSNWLTMPYEPIKISLSKNWGGSYDRVSITDEDGITYIFGTPVQPNNETYKYLDANDDNRITTWHLNSIISANKKDSILINYVKPSIVTYIHDGGLQVCDYLHENSRYNGATPLYFMLYDFFTYHYLQQNVGGTVSHAPSAISSIRLKREGSLVASVDFNYEQSYSGPKYLRNMTVKNTLNQIIKSINFILKNNINNKLKLLDKIEFGYSSADKEIYRFDYYDNTLIPSLNELSLNSDWWRYYSRNAGALYGGTITVRKPLLGIAGGEEHITNLSIQGGNKASDLSSMLTGMIKGIHYPTGGRTEFEYEANKFHTGAVCGGLRIKRLNNISASGKSEYKYYEYEAGGGSVLYPPSNNQIVIENEIECYGEVEAPGIYTGIGEGRYRQRNFLTTFPSQYTDFHSNIVNYGRVTEYIGYSSTSNNGKTVYEYSTWTPNIDYFLSVNGSEFEGYPRSGRGYQHKHVSPTDFWTGNKLISRTVYQGARKVEESKYTYKVFSKKSIYDMPVFQYRHHQVTTRFDSNDTQEIKLIVELFHEVFAFIHQQYTIGAEKLIKEIKHSYTDAGIITTVKEVTYDPEFLFPVTEKITNSNGNNTITSYSYPFSSNYKYSFPYSEMITRNQLSPLIQKSTSTNNSTMTTTNEYDKWGTYAYYPSRTVSHKSGYGNDNLLVFNKYTSGGRPLHLTVKDAENVVYLWSYNQQYPVAAIRNATYEQVRNALGGEGFIERLANSMVPSDSDLAAINNLRSVLLHSQITTCTYRPLVGKLTETDPTGFTTYFEYDVMNRLVEIYIYNGNRKEVIEAYQYHYVNPK